MPREVQQRCATTAAVNVSRLWMLPLVGLCLASFGLRCDARAVSSPSSRDIQLFARHISPTLGHTTTRNMPHIPLTHTRTHTHWDTLAHLAVGHIQSELLNTGNTCLTIAITSFRAGADKALLRPPPTPGPCVSLCCGVLSVKRLRMLHKEELIN